MSNGIRIQPDWDKAVLEKDKNFWFHLYDSACTRYHHIDLSGGGLIPDSENVECRVVSPKTIRLRDAIRRLQTTFQCPDVRFTTVHKFQREPTLNINSFDVNNSGELAVSAASDKNVFLWETKTGEIRRSFEGHVSEVYCCRFFPSGLVVLTGGSDMQLKVWSAVNGECGATLKPGLGGAGGNSQAAREPGGHRAGVVDVDFLERGKNVVALDRGGWLRLWDVSSQIAISAISTVPRAFGYTNCPLEDSPNCCVVKGRPSSWTSSAEPKLSPDDAGQFPALETSSTNAVAAGVADRLVAVGTGAGGCGQTLLFDLNSPETRQSGPVLRLIQPSGRGGTVTACAMSVASSADGDCGSSIFEEFGLVAGGSRGDVACWDLRHPTKPVIAYDAYKSGVAALKLFRFRAQESPSSSAFPGLMTAFCDGRIIFRQLGGTEVPGGFSRFLELTGPDVDPIRGVSIMSRSSGGGDGVSLWSATQWGQFFNYRRLALDSLFS